MPTQAKFDVEVRFMGICAFVPDDDLPKAKKLCVVLVNGTDPNVITKARTALDGNDLRFHRGIVRIPYANLAPTVALPEEPEVIWYIKPGTRISFRTTPTSASEGNLQFDLLPPVPTNITSFKYVAAMEKVLDSPCDIDPDALSTAPSDHILAQILFQGGSVATSALPDTLWNYEPNLASTPYGPTKLSHGVSVRFHDVTQASMMVTDVQAGKSQSVELMPDANAAALVEVANMCRDNPLAWELSDPAVTDVDVRWYYELLDSTSRKKLSDLLTKMRVPLPLAVPRDAGSGPDCSPFLYKPAFFDALAKAEFGKA